MNERQPRHVVYVIGSDGSTRVKIGTSRKPEQRLSCIQHMCPIPLRIMWSTPGDQRLEVELHRHFKDRRTHGEWFEFGEDDPVQMVSTAVDEILTRRAAAELVEPAAQFPKESLLARGDIWQIGEAKAGPFRVLIVSAGEVNQRFSAAVCLGLHESGAYPDTALSVALANPPAATFALNLVEVREDRFTSASGAVRLGSASAEEMGRVRTALRHALDLP